MPRATQSTPAFSFDWQPDYNPELTGDEAAYADTQAYRVARNRGMTHERAIELGRQELEGTPGNDRYSPTVEDLGVDYGMTNRKPPAGGGGGGGGNGRITPEQSAQLDQLLGGDQNLLRQIAQDIEAAYDEPNFQFGQQDNNLQYRQSLAAKNAMMKNQGNQSMQGTERLVNNPMMHFGQGGGDWASQFGRMTEPRPGIFGAIAGNQANLAAGGYANQLNQTFNSPSGPYGQMQAAAAVTAPARASRDIAAMQTSADRDIARMRFDTTQELFGKLLGRMGQAGDVQSQPISGIETDYGGFAKITPNSAKKYMPGGPAR